MCIAGALRDAVPSHILYGLIHIIRTYEMECKTCPQVLLVSSMHDSLHDPFHTFSMQLSSDLLDSS